MKSFSHSYAAAALNCIETISSHPKAKDYGRLCFIFPSMIYVNGLRLTTAFFESKASKDSIYRTFLNDIGEVLHITNWQKDVPGTMIAYQELTEHALAACVWFKRYAEAILKVEFSDQEMDL